jgi:hypothetical protein
LSFTNCRKGGKEQHDGQSEAVCTFHGNLREGRGMTILSSGGVGRLEGIILDEPELYKSGHGKDYARRRDIEGILSMKLAEPAKCGGWNRLQRSA